MAAVPNPLPAPTLSTAAQALVTTFNTSLTADQRTNFANTLQNSPALITQINTAVAAGELRGFGLLAAGTNAGGQLNNGTLELPAAIMSTPAQPPGARFNPAELTYVVGHETQHAIYHPTVATALTAFDAEIWRIAQTRQPIHDYTAPLNTMLAVNRDDESAAHIAGFNATVGMVRSTNASPSLEDIYRASPGRMGEFINVTPGTPATYALRDGYAVNADMTMTANATNMDAAGRHYFDQPAASARLGHHGDSNYQNNYAAELVGAVVRSERFYAPGLAAAGVTPAPQIAINMTSLGLNEAQLERNGLNLGDAAGRQPYLNTGTTPPTAGNFDHTIVTHAHVPVTMPNALPSVPGPAEPPLHPAVRQAMDAMDRSPNISADDFGQNRQRVAAGVALHAADQKLTPDHVVFNDRRTDLIAVQGSHMSDPTARLSTPLPVADALTTNLVAAQQKLDALQPASPQAPTEQVVGRNLATQQDNPVQEAVRPVR
jgi:hypothetical protein